MKKNKLSKLRQLPEKTKRIILYLTVTVIMIGIVIFWTLSLTYKNYGLNSKEENNQKDKFLKELNYNFNKSFESLKEELQKFKNFIQKGPVLSNQSLSNQEEELKSNKNYLKEEKQNSNTNP